MKNSHDSIPFRLLISIGLFLFSTCFLFNVAGAENRLQPRPSTLESVLKNGKLRVGVSLFAPWTLKNKQGKLIGFEIDVAKQLAKDLGVRLELKEFEWEDMLPALLKKHIDIIAAGMVITPQRALKVNFSQPYADSGLGLATNIALTKNFTGLKDLNEPNTIIAVVAGTVAEDLAQRIFPKATIKRYQQSEKAIQAVTQGTVHAYVEHNPISHFHRVRPSPTGG